MISTFASFILHEWIEGFMSTKLQTLQCMIKMKIYIYLIMFSKQISLIKIHKTDLSDTDFHMTLHVYNVL
jgi:hypothetical protein